jgi:hypothetical protein
MISDRHEKGLKWWTKGHTFAMDMTILRIGSYDAILGINWPKNSY